MKTLTYLSLLTLLLIFPNCNKENFANVRYQVNCRSRATISYTMNDRSFSITDESGSWSVRFRARRGTNYFLSAMQNSPLFNMDVVVSIDGDVVEQSSSRSLNFVTLSGVIP